MTGSKDGFIRLWSCGQQKTIEPKIEINDIINSLDMCDSDSSLLDSDPDVMDEDEVGTLGKLLGVGTENGSVLLVDLKGRKVISSIKLNSAVNKVKFYDNFLVAGTQDGMVQVLCIPDLFVKHKIHDSNSAITAIQPLKNGFLIGQHDGTCIWYGLDSNSDSEVNHQKILLSGADIDPVNDIAKDHNFVYTACRDGVVRKYSINAMFK